MIKMKTKIHYITFLAAIFLTLNGFSQLNQEKVKQIDSLFAPWNTENHPGGTVLICQKGETIFSRAYGLASLEYNIPSADGWRPRPARPHGSTAAPTSAMPGPR